VTPDDVSARLRAIARTIDTSDGLSRSAIASELREVLAAIRVAGITLDSLREKYGENLSEALEMYCDGDRMSPEVYDIFVSCVSKVYGSEVAKKVGESIKSLDEFFISMPVHELLHLVIDPEFILLYDDHFNESQTPRIWRNHSLTN